MITTIQPTALGFLATSVQLYPGPGPCMHEICRNGVYACMEPGTWQPEKARIDIRLETHPLSEPGQKTLLVIDYGRGLTEPDLKRYFQNFGTALSDAPLALKALGIAQNGLGRFAALGLVRGCVEGKPEDRVNNGYYIASRTSKAGKVRLVSVIPAEIERLRGFETGRFLDPDDRNLGSLGQIVGSFTAVVIPDPVLTSEAEIREAIRPYLPCDASKMYHHFTVGGQQLAPPRLESTINVVGEDPAYHAHFSSGPVNTRGLHLCDSTTGLPVASISCIAHHIPEVLNSPELRGNIFAPGLLAKQNVGRDRLAPNYVRESNRAWQNLRAFLVRYVAPKAAELIEAKPVDGIAATVLSEVVDVFKDRYGEPDPVKNEFVPPTGTNPPGPKTPREPGNGGTQTDPGEKQKHPRCIRVKIDNQTYVLYRARQMDQYILVMLDIHDTRRLMINIGTFSAFPRNPVARREFFILAIMQAIATQRFPTDPYQASRTANMLYAGVSQRDKKK